MPIRLSPPIEKEFVLEVSDKILGNEGDPTTITIKQASEGENLQRMALWKRFERRMDLDGGMSVTQDVSPAEVKRKEIFLTLTACNLDGVDGQPLFIFPLTERLFNEAYAKLPPVIADEIHKKVLEINLTWASEGESR